MLRASTDRRIKKAGRVHGVLLGHTTSSEILKAKFNEHSEESVGYAAIVF